MHQDVFQGSCVMNNPRREGLSRLMQLGWSRRSHFSPVALSVLFTVKSKEIPFSGVGLIADVILCTRGSEQTEAAHLGDCLQSNWKEVPRSSTILRLLWVRSGFMAWLVEIRFV